MSAILLKSVVNVKHYNIQWKIENYGCLRVKKNFLHESGTFETGMNNGEWSILLYPEGDEAASEGYVTLGLSCKHKQKYSICYEFSLINKKSEKMFAQKLVGDDFTSGVVFDFIQKNIVFDEKNKLLDNGTLTINLHMEMVDDISKSTYVKPQVEPEFNPLPEDYLNLLNSSTMHDLVIKVNNRSFKVHKLVLAARSPVFTAMFSHDLTENNSNVLDIQDVDPEVMEVVIQYFYSGRCHQLEEMAEAVLPVSDKYGLEHLKSQCDSMLSSQLSLENVIRFLSLADIFRLKELKKNSINFICVERDKILHSTEWERFASANNKLALDVLTAVTRSFLSLKSN